MNMKLREICALTDVSKRNIHYYIQEGLLLPETDPGSGYYEFTQEDCDRLRIIRSLRNADFSLAQIRAVLDKPSTAVYYLNLRLKQLKTQQAHLEKVISAVGFVEKNLPIHPDYGQMADLIMAAGIPEPSDIFSVNDTEPRDSDLVSRYLWESFLPEAPLTNYQEYLWNKVCEFSSGPYAADYQSISDTLLGFTEQEIVRSFADNRHIHQIVVSLDESEYTDYARDMEEQLRLFLESPILLRHWRSRYDGLIAPSTRIYDSAIGDTVEELNPSFARYRKNIHAVCADVYTWLSSPEGLPLQKAMEQALSGQYDIENCHHGQLQAMAVYGAEKKH